DLVVATPVGSAWMEAALPQAFEKLFRTHIVELPGTGGSEGDPAAASIESVVAAIGDVSASLEAPVLFGDSMNGTLVLAAGSSVPCRGVIAVAPPSSLPASQADRAAYWEHKAEGGRRERGGKLIDERERTVDEQHKARLQERIDRLRRWYEL